MLKKVLVVFFLIMVFPAISNAGVIGKAVPVFTLVSLGGKKMDFFNKIGRTQPVNVRFN